MTTEGCVGSADPEYTQSLGPVRGAVIALICDAIPESQAQRHLLSHHVIPKMNGSRIVHTTGTLDFSQRLLGRGFPPAPVFGRITRTGTIRLYVGCCTSRTIPFRTGRGHGHGQWQNADDTVFWS